MKKAIVVLLFLLAFGSTAFGSNEVVKTTSIDVNEPLRSAVHGSFTVSVYNEGEWVEAGSLGFNRFFRRKTLDLSPLDLEDLVRVRIEQEGGGAAHIDAVSFGGLPALSVSSPDLSPLDEKKLRAVDNDVADAFGRVFELEFPASADGSLELTARVEAEEIPVRPFHYTRSSPHEPVSLHSRFYTYALGTESTDPLFRELCRPGTGHPRAYTTTWVWNDEQYLYARLDFASDNTMDGDLDYVTLYAKTDDDVKAFRVSVPETTWGSPSFVYTEDVPYQHKVYDFRIPLAEIGSGQEIELAFEAYGTVGEGVLRDPKIVYDFVNRRHLLVHDEVLEEPYFDVVGQFCGPDGTLSGEQLVITESDGYDGYPHVGFDGSDEVFLVVWSRGPFEEAYGQIVPSGATSLTPSNFEIPPVVVDEEQIDVVVAGNGDGSFLVAWSETSDASGIEIMGRMVDTDGTAGLDAITICSNTLNQYDPAVAFDPENDRFLVVWKDARTGDSDSIWGQFVSSDGTPTGGNFQISDENATDPEDPGVACNTADGSFLVLWSDFRGADQDIYGRLVMDSDDFLPAASDRVICDAVNTQSSPDAAYLPSADEFLVAWLDDRVAMENEEIYGLYTEGDGSYTAGDFAVVEYLGDVDSLGSPSVSAVTQSRHTLVACLINGDQITLTLVGDSSPFIIISPGSLDFDSVHTGSSSDARTVTVSNGSSVDDLSVGSLTISGEGADAFAIQNDDVSDRSIDWTQDATFEVVFSPQSTGTYEAVISIPSNDPEESTAQVLLSGTAANAAPGAATLVFPEDGTDNIDTDVIFIWRDAADADGDAVSYTFYLGTDEDFTDVTPVEIASNGNPEIMFAGFGLVLGLSLLGAFRFRRRGAKILFIVLVAALLIAALTLASCGGGGGDDGDGTTPEEIEPEENPLPADGETSHVVTGLLNDTTYYWKVVTDDGLGGTTESEVYSFTTIPSSTD